MKTDLFRKTLRNVVEARRAPEVRIEETFDHIDQAYEWIEGLSSASSQVLDDYADPEDEYLVLVAHYPAGQDKYGETNLAGYFEVFIYPEEIEEWSGRYAQGDNYPAGGGEEIYRSTGAYRWMPEDIHQYEDGKLIAKL
jgi:hypothetical protein